MSAEGAHGRVEPATTTTTCTGAPALEHIKDAIRQVHAATPDMTFAIEDSVEDGDTIWVRVRGPGRPGAPSSAHRADGR